MLFADSIKNLSLVQREEAIVSAVLAGNVPEHMQGFVPVTIGDVTINVKPDYLMVDPVEPLYVPLWPTSAQRLADALGCILPNTFIVDAIWWSSRAVEPQPWGAPYDSSMSSTERVVAHSKRVRKTIATLDGQLVAAHKKDVVITNKLPKDRVAIYGWHQANGKPIQSLHTEHSNHYCDYSHGIRLVSRTCTVGGQETDILNLLADGKLSNEGPMKVLSYTY